MHQNPLKILCAYYDREFNWLGAPPEEELRGHQVTVAHAYNEAKGYILDEKRGVPAFDIVLADAGLPGGFEDVPDDNIPIFCPILLQPYLDRTLCRGVGIFVPKHFETEFDSSDGYSVVVASQECWTPMGKRDWSKLLDLVIRASDDADRFNTRTPKKGAG